MTIPRPEARATPDALELANKIWALREAATPSGLAPNAQSVAEFCKSLEGDGLLCRSENGLVWMITDAGRAFLQETSAND